MREREKEKTREREKEREERNETGEVPRGRKEGYKK
jgi:hypothetical protein